MAKELKGKFFLIFTATFIFILVITIRISRTDTAVPKPRWAPSTCPLSVSEETITPLVDTKHLLVSAYVDQRVKGFDLRIIGIFKRDSIRPLYCRFCCVTRISSTTPATIIQHSDNFGFPYATTDVLCQIPEGCDATHVSLLSQGDEPENSHHVWLPVRNQKSEEEEKKPQFDFTVCISNLFAKYNNVLQFAQTLEMYRLLGVGRVVIYNTSCGPDLERLLQGYVQEGFVEMVPWPIDKHLVPSTGWLFSRSGGDVHYFGQLATLNECIYRSMERSRYVLLNDIDEIAMPYKYDSLKPLMETLQQQHPHVGVFLIENHIFPKSPFEDRKDGPLPTWRGVPGFNILQHVFREEPDRSQPHPFKMIVDPRLVEQTSVHEVLKTFGQVLKVPPELCHIIHSPLHVPKPKPLERLRVDTRLWDFKDQLLPSMKTVLERAGLLRS
ncbi:uncharacterized protein [Brachionichthys hirsutus]|uniref:uncharacterized protein n=1 Tax=Brachionichthys hirsutus TaxID=412623 RepID=UPI003604A864